jgi:hypothetical protein
MQMNLSGGIHQERERQHNMKCENANPKGKCACGCGGSMHGLNRMENHGITDERTITERMGGEIEQEIKKLMGKHFYCGGNCKQKITIGAWLGYPHEGGLADKNGKRWWVYIECPKCEYDWSIGKLPTAIERAKLEEERHG